MTDIGDAAVEAAQNVVDEVTSWEYSGDPERIAAALDEGWQKAQVQVPGDERSRLISEIDGVKDDEGKGSPQVRSAQPL